MKKIFSLIFILGLFSWFCTNVMAAQQVFETEGVFVMGDNDTNVAAKEFAVQDAKRLALEQAGTYLRSNTQVVNGQVTKDDIVSIASGVIKLDKIIKEENKLNNNVISFVVKARFIIDNDDLDKKIEILQQSSKQLRQEEIQKLADLQNSYTALLAENNKLKTELAKTNDQNTKKRLLLKTQDISNRLAVTQWNDRGKEFFDANKFDSAVSAHSKAIALAPQFASSYYFRGNSYSKSGRYNLAIADYNTAIALDPQNSNAYYYRGNSYMMSGQYDLAIADLNKVIALDPKYAMAYHDRGISYGRQGHYDLAIVDLSKAIAFEPQYVPGYNNRGLYYANSKQYDLAIADYTKAISLNRQDPSAYNHRADAYDRKGQESLAIDDYSKVIALDPQNAAAYTTRAKYYLKKGKYDLAIADYNSIIALKRGDKTTYNDRGYSYYKKGQYELALADFIRALEIDRDYADAKNNYQMVLKILTNR